MKTIWKYPLAPGRNDVTMPWPAQILTVGAQGDRVSIWALVDPGAARITRAVDVVATGQELEDTGQYLGTFQLADGALVFHVFTDEL